MRRPRQPRSYGKIIAHIRLMDAGDVRHFRHIGLAMIALGALLMIGFGALVAQEMSWRGRSVVVAAQVTGLREWPQERGPPLVSAAFAFRLPDGSDATAFGASAARACCRVGEVVRLRVDPARPGFVEPAEAAGAGTALAVVAIGAVFVLLGGAGVAIARRGAREGRGAG